MPPSGSRAPIHRSGTAQPLVTLATRREEGGAVRFQEDLGRFLSLSSPRDRIVDLSVVIPVLTSRPILGGVFFVLLPSKRPQYIALSVPMQASGDLPTLVSCQPVSTMPPNTVHADSELAAIEWANIERRWFDNRYKRSFDDGGAFEDDTAMPKPQESSKAGWV